jgi:cytochrome c553
MTARLYLILIQVPAFVFAFLFSATVADEPGRVDFARDVRPVFANRCLRCHGSKKREGGLRIDNKRLTLYHNGIQRRLTDVQGSVLYDLLA